MRDRSPDLDQIFASRGNEWRILSVLVVTEVKCSEKHGQDIRSPGRPRRPVDGHRLVLRHGGIGHRARHRARLRRRLVLVQRQAGGEGRRRRARHTRRGAEALRHRRRSHAASRAPHAEDLHRAVRATQRVRHRPQPAACVGRSHPGHLASARRRRASRRPRPRAESRRQPRHPHRIGRRGRRDGHHVRRAYGDVGCDLRRRWRRRRRRQHLRPDRDGDPGADRRPPVADGALAVA